MLNGQLTFRYVHPLELKGYWNLVKHGVQKVTEKQHIFLVEDVYADLKSGQADLHLALVEDDYVGFVILQKVPHHDGIALHIWMGYSVDNTKGDILTESLPILKEWATSINAKRLTFSSTRKGWEKNKIGWKPLHTVYSIEME